MDTTMMDNSAMFTARCALYTINELRKTDKERLDEHRKAFANGKLDAMLVNGEMLMGQELFNHLFVENR